MLAAVKTPLVYRDKSLRGRAAERWAKPLQKPCARMGSVEVGFRPSPVPPERVDLRYLQDDPECFPNPYLLLPPQLPKPPQFTCSVGLQYPV